MVLRYYTWGMITLDEILERRIKEDELSSREAEELLNVSRLTLANWRNAKVITPLRQTKQYGYVYSLEDVLRIGEERGHPK